MADTSLKDFPTLFDGVAMPFPNSWSENSEVVEEVVTSEAGTDIIQVVRYDKLKVSASYKVLSPQAKVFKEFSKQASIQVSIYDQIEEDYVVRTMRIRNFTANFISGSQVFTVTKGVWDISFDLLEI